MVNVTYDSSESRAARTLAKPFIDFLQSGEPCGSNRVWRVQPWRYCLDIGLNRLGMDHDTRRRLLLFWSLAEEECSQHDLS